MDFRIDFDERPFIVIWETTQACDLACVHCRARTTLPQSRARQSRRFSRQQLGCHLQRRPTSQSKRRNEQPRDERGCRFRTTGWFYGWNVITFGLPEVFSMHANFPPLLAVLNGWTAMHESAGWPDWLTEMVP